MANRATGAVTRLYVTEGRTYIRLQIPQSQQPKDGYFELLQSHQNYDALYSLALSAAAKGVPLQVRTYGEITPTDYPNVNYLVVDW
jgi:hypothetical protein